MPAQVVVVKRSRRRAFAILRSLPAWLLALVATVRVAGRRRAPVDLERFEAFRGSKLLAPERRSGILSPRLVESADLAGCPSCTRCLEICPSRALALGVSNGVIPLSSGTSAIQLELDPGRCIGCGECVRVCPSKLLEMIIDAKRVGEGARPASRSLLMDHSISAGERADVH